MTGIGLAVAVGVMGIVVAPHQAPASAAGPVTDEVDLYVGGQDADGQAASDANACTDALPCATITRALDVATDWFDDDRDTVTVRIAAGTYPESLDIHVPGKTLVLQGAGAQSTVIDANQVDTTINITHGTVRINDVTITGGEGESGEGGGLGISSAFVYLTDSIVTGNRAFTGDAARLTDSGAWLEATRSTFSDNGRRGAGYRVFENRGTLRLQESTVADNHGSTFLSNHGTVWIGGSTIQDSGMLNAGSEPARVTRSIIDGPTCSNGLTDDAGFNVFTDAACRAGDTSTVSSRDRIGLQPLAPNGWDGPRTMALLPGSTALGRVPLFACGEADQRGEPRPGSAGSDHCDAGAFELRYTPHSAVYVGRGPTTDDECFTPDVVCATLQQGVDLAQRELRSGAPSVTVHLGASIWAPVVIDATRGTLILEGAGVGRSTIEPWLDPAVTVRSGEVEIHDLTIRGGLAGRGGGLTVDPGATVRLEDSAVSDSVASGDPADDEGLGGGIYNAGDLTVSRSVLSGNRAGRGGAIYSTGTLTIDSSTMQHNAAAQGSALFATGAVAITSSTIEGWGSASLIETTGTTEIFSSTITDGALVAPDRGFLVIWSILEGVTCTGVDDMGGNVVTDSSCHESYDSSGATPADLGLGDLADNGGPTPTMAIGPASAAHAIVPRAECGSTDQRGEPRPGIVDGLCDSGAFELQRDEVGADYYADAAAGSDTSTCTTADHPCRTLTGALDAAAAAIGTGLEAATVHVAAGTYAGPLWIEVPSEATITIDGAGADSTTIDADGAGPVVSMGSGSLVLRDLTLSGGDNDNGGGLAAFPGTDVELLNTYVTGNTADRGGGIYAAGTLTVTSSTISENTATVDGSAVYQEDGEATIVRTTVVGNDDAESRLIWAGGTVDLVSSTLSGGVIEGEGTFHGLGFETLDTSRITVSGSILSDVVCSGDVRVGAVYFGTANNVVSDASCGYADLDAAVMEAFELELSTNVYPVEEIGLAPLGNYGGATPTMPPASDSPAVQPAHLLDFGEADCFMAGAVDVKAPLLPGLSPPGESSATGCDVGAVQLVETSLHLGTGPGAVTATVPTTGLPDRMQVPAGTVQFTDDRGVVPGCAAVPVTGTDAVCPGLPFGPVTAELTAVNGYRTATATDAGVTALRLSPPNASIRPGNSLRYTVTALGPDGETLGNVTESSVLEVTDGRCIGRSCSASTAGRHTITATRGDLQASASLNVTPARSTNGSPSSGGTRTDGTSYCGFAVRIGPYGAANISNPGYCPTFGPGWLPSSPFPFGGPLYGVNPNYFGGAQFSVRVGGFAPFGWINFGIYSTPTVLATATADATGSATAELTIPEGLTGEHTLVAIGLGPDGEIRQLSATITITPPDDAAPSPPHEDETDAPTTTATTAPAPTGSGLPWLPFAVVGFGLLLLIGAAVTIRAVRRGRAG